MSIRASPSTVYVTHSGAGVLVGMGIGVPVGSGVLVGVGGATAPVPLVPQALLARTTATRRSAKLVGRRRVRRAPDAGWLVGVGMIGSFVPSQRLAAVLTVYQRY